MRQLLTERYRERLAGVLSCYDRIIITGTLPAAGLVPPREGSLRPARRQDLLSPARTGGSIEFQRTAGIGATSPRTRPGEEPRSTQ